MLIKDLENNFREKKIKKLRSNSAVYVKEEDFNNSNDYTFYIYFNVIDTEYVIHIERESSNHYNLEILRVFMSLGINYLESEKIVKDLSDLKSINTEIKSFLYDTKKYHEDYLDNLENFFTERDNEYIKDNIAILTLVDKLKEQTQVSEEDILTLNNLASKVATKHVNISFNLASGYASECNINNIDINDKSLKCNLVFNVRKVNGNEWKLDINEIRELELIDTFSYEYNLLDIISRRFIYFQHSYNLKFLELYSMNF